MNKLDLVQYDILFCASTFKTSKYAISFLKSLKNIKGKNLAVITTPIFEDVIQIVQELKNFPTDVIIFKTDVDNQCLARAWGFVWAVNNGITARYYCSCDDDIEFNQNSKDILDKLDEISMSYNFSMLAFDSTHPYKYPYFEKQIENLKFNPPFIDGNCIFTHFEDNLNFGVMDAPLEEPAVFYTEIEYMHRLKYFTNRPAIVNIEKEFYVHNYNTFPEKNKIRSERFQKREQAGRKFWFQKFGITVPEFNSDFVANEIFEEIINKNLTNKFKQHLIFKGEWNNWNKIYEDFSKFFQICGENFLWKINPFKIKTKEVFQKRENRIFKLTQFDFSSFKKKYNAIKLHLGCGEKYLDGYINIDYPPSEHTVANVKADLFYDITKLIFPKESVDEIRLHHVFEHFDRTTAFSLLIKWHEWLKVGGLLHIETPDLKGCAEVIVSDAPIQTKQAIIRHIFGSHEAKWAYHLDGWFDEKFIHILQHFGFEVNVKTWKWNRYPYLPNIEIFAIKRKNFDRIKLIETAKNLLNDYLVDNVKSEIEMHQVWVNALLENLGIDNETDGILINNNHTNIQKEKSVFTFRESNFSSKEINIYEQTEVDENFGYGDDNFMTNGEYFIALNIIPNDAIVFDLGANEGAWSNFILKNKKISKLFMFEPIPELYFKLIQTFNQPNVLIYNFAFSDKRQKKTFYYYPTLNALSGLFRRGVELEQKLNIAPNEIQIYTTTLDEFCRINSIHNIDFVKIDTEGAEYFVLKGAVNLLKEEKINIIQFEYGGTFIDSGTPLKGIWDLLKMYGYEIFRIVPDGLIYLTFWKDSLENYTYSNYLGISQNLAKELISSYGNK